MTDWSKQIVSTSAPLPPRTLIYGPNGIGKTSFAASLPMPLLIDYDHGAAEVPIPRVPGPATWDLAMDLVRNFPVGFSSIAIDTVDALEKLAVAKVLGTKKSLNLDFKWGEGHEQVAGLWREFLAALDALQARGALVCLLGHSVIRTAQDPQLGEYDQHTSLLGKKVWAATKAWADIVGFVNFDAALVEGQRGNMAIVTGARMLYTTRGTGFEAKNRFGIDAPLPFPKLDTFAPLRAAIERHRGVADVIEAEIRSVAKGTALEAKAEEAIKEAKRDTTELLEIRTQLIESLKETRS
jgi:hypothetical protein